MALHVSKKKSLGISPVYQRLITAFILVVLISTLVISNEIAFLLLVIAINQLTLMEYNRLVELSNFSLQKFIMEASGALLIILSWFICKQILPPTTALAIFILGPAVMTIELFRKKDTPFQNVGLGLLGLIWISVPLALFLFTGYLPNHSTEYYFSIVLGYFIILWFGDSGAFFTGKLIGKRKVFERISPKKTWEGTFGGLASVWIASYLNYMLFSQFTLIQWLILATIIYITGVFGDFGKSMLKRSVGVKDSSHLLPGHGGILDRFDSLIGSAPFAFLYFMFYV